MGPAGLGPLIGPFVVEGYIDGPLSFEDMLKKGRSHIHGPQSSDEVSPAKLSLAELVETDISSHLSTWVQ